MTLSWINPCITLDIELIPIAGVVSNSGDDYHYETLYTKMGVTEIDCHFKDVWNIRKRMFNYLYHIFLNERFHDLFHRLAISYRRSIHLTLLSIWVIFLRQKLLTALIFTKTFEKRELNMRYVPFYIYYNLFKYSLAFFQWIWWIVYLTILWVVECNIP